MRKKQLNESKRMLFYFVLFCTSLFVSCSDEVEGRITVDDTPPAKVTNVSSNSGPGEVYLSWTNPESSSFMYTKIEYTDANGELKYRLLSKERAARDTIRGFATTDPIQFSIYSCSVRGTHDGFVEYTASPDAPAFSQVAEAMNILPDLGGIIVSGKNEFAAPVYIVLNYQLASNSSMSGTARFLLNGNAEVNQFIQLTANGEVLTGSNCIINVIGEDEAANASEPFVHRVTPIKVDKLDKSNWKFPDYDENSNTGTIGYSSHETQGEGAAPNGRVVAMLDNNTATYWHASWKVTAYYPHWFILDMGSDMDISSIELQRRQGDARGQKGQTIYTCPQSAAGNVSDPDSWGWTNHGSYSFDSDLDAPQCYRLSTNPKVRYIKIYFGTEYKGTGNQAMLSEFNVYGVE